MPLWNLDDDYLDGDDEQSEYCEECGARIRYGYCKKCDTSRPKWLKSEGNDEPELEGDGAGG